jgi:hypothetical protein
MDLLFKRYASPFLLVDQMILTGNFTEFVAKLVELDADEELWQFFLHKVEGQSFNDWKASLGVDQQAKTQMSDDEIKATVQSSFSILNGYEPT